MVVGVEWLTEGMGGDGGASDSDDSATVVIV